MEIKLLEMSLQVSFKRVSRSAKGMADALAKQGVDGETLLLLLSRFFC